MAEPTRIGGRAAASSAAAREEAPLYELIELLFFAYRDFVGDADRLLEAFGFGRAHHRVLHFVSRHPGLTIAALLDILKITKQSLNRVLKELVAKNFIDARAGATDRRHRQLYATEAGEKLARDLAKLQTRRFAAALEEVGPGAKAMASTFLQAMIDAPERERVMALIASGRGSAEMSAAELADDAAHLLVVDDDRRLRDLLSAYLSKHRHRVTVAASAAEARGFLANLSFDLIVLDVMMPGENGFAFAESLRKRSDVPIVMLTARSDAADRVRGLEIGVDDYLAKPFEPRELLLRIGSVLRRTRAPAPKSDSAVARFGPFTFSLERGELRNGAEIVRLTEREREILRLLCASAGASVSREALSGAGAAAQERTVDVQINRLRRKIEVDPANPVYLQTARGSGYRLLADG